jgi:pimeloyl-ACP methyl ester carboxylesterase
VFAALAALAVLAAMMAVLAVAPAGPGYAAGGPSAPMWGACPPGGPRDPRQRCATLQVPLDYRDPHGRSIDIVISRISTARPQLRRGILLSNPSGPGAQGIDFPSTLAAYAPPEVLDRYDLIGFDPRGVGYSTPVTCGLPPDGAYDPYPAPDGSIAGNIGAARTVADACAAHSAGLLPHLTTANTARDMDRIRAALGEPTLSYYGVSYGTYLGEVYTTLFPQRSDRIVLDSAVDPRRVGYDQWRVWGPGTAIRFPDFTGWAAARDATYHLGATAQQVYRTYFRLAADLDRDPLTTPQGLVITGNFFRAYTRSALYFDLLFPDLATGWRYVATRGATPLPTPCGVPKLCAAGQLRFYAARSYSVMSPPRTGRRLIRW